MAREDTPLDQETFDKVLAEELAKGTDRRVAEGRARSAAVRALRAKTGEGMEGAQARRGGRGLARGTSSRSVRGTRGSGGSRAPGRCPVRRSRHDRGAIARPRTGGRSRRGCPQPRRRRRRRFGRDRRRPGTFPSRRRGPRRSIGSSRSCPPEGIQRVEREQGDRINVWPHLLIEEFIALLIVLATLTIFSTFVNAPLRELANPNLTPNPSKAPWYFLGLQELLRYFHPMIAGVVFAPTLVLLALAVTPFVDRNPSTKPGDRKLAITLFTMLMMFGATLTIIGSFFRGTGYNWVWPWAQGVFFEL